MSRRTLLSYPAYKIQNRERWEFRMSNWSVNKIDKDSG